MVSETTMTARIRPSTASQTAVLPSASALSAAVAKRVRSLQRPLVAQPAVAPGGEHVLLDDAGNAAAAVVFEVCHGRQRAGLGGMRCDGASDRMLRCVLESSCQPEHFGAGRVVGGVHGCDRHLAGRHGAGLVQHDGVDAPRRLQDLRGP